MADMKYAIDFPTPVKRPVGLLLDSISAAPEAGLRWLNGVTWTQLGCAAPHVQNVNLCTYNSEDLEPDDYPDTVSQLPFNVWDGLHCSTRGKTAVEIQDRLRADFAVVESYAWASELISGAASGGLSLSDTSTVNAGPSSVLDSLAYLEGALAESLHGGQGIIHVSPELMNYAASRFRFVDGVYYTATGHKVISDAGYTDAASPVGEAAASSTQDWMYASGPVFYYRKAPEYRGVGSDQTDYLHNHINALIESYGLLIFEPCAVAASLTSYSLD